MAADSKKWLKFRLASLLAIFLVLFIALLSRAFQLQVLSGEQLKKMAQRQHITTLPIHSERGMIYDRNGEKLAMSVLADSVCADPSRINDPAKASRRIAAVLNLNAETVFRKISEPKSFCWLARKISPEQAAQVEAANIEGVFLIKEPKRFYPNGPLAAHLIGFSGFDAEGLEGLEKKYDAYLRGKPEKLTWARDAKGKKLFLHVERAASPRDSSANLVLTIDSRIQYLVETHLKQAVQDKGAKGGVAIVMDPKTGEILALANEKAFNPNNIRRLTPDIWRNRAIADAFDPGSTFKPFLVAAALEEKVVREADRFFCENGHYVVANRVIREANRKRHGYLSVRDILKYSSNIGSAKIAEKLGREKYYDYIRSFGFGAKTGIDLSGEAIGLLRPAKNWTRVDTAAIAFGQGISVTAIQLITAMSAIANEGVLMKPFVVRGLTDRNNQPIKMFGPETVRRVVSAQTSRRLTAMLTQVVGAEDGTGKNAHIVNVDVAGKTGTAQKFDFARGVYSSERVRTSFIGFFPSDNPQVVILVILDEPQRDKWGGVAAAPVFRNIGEQILNCFKTNIRETPVFEPPKPGSVELVAADETLLEKAAVLEENFDDDASLMPDFTGLTIREALRKAKSRSIDLQISGSGWAVKQMPAPGSALGDERLCRVVFERKD
ncbi:MAG: penicillin-binding protein [Smithellaceae bacterium]|nr:transpeptidase family protein [Syntrophaceae bacterium]MDD4241191.1 penicillin-binding protein [Smithellaceae bacterium]NLX51551.1 transpeptidase family protein [Deltaproteobacteria bacterium]